MKVLQEIWAVGLNINDSEKKLDLRGSSGPTRGIIHVYYHNIQTSSWPTNAKFYVKHLYWNGIVNVFINNLGHMTKMAAMPIYGKNPSKISFSRTGGRISKKFGMKYQ